MNAFDAIFDILKQCPDLELRRDVPMSQHTTFRIGGAVPLMAVPRSGEALALCRRVACEGNVRSEVVGRGSNLLVADEGAEVFVISTEGLTEMKQISDTEIVAQSGILLARLANFAADRNLAGLTFAHGIPGSLGGAVAMNGGAYGGEMAQVVTSVRALSERGELIEIAGENLQFGYRHSMLQEHDYTVLDATLTLTVGDGEQLRSEMATFSEKRRNSQPLEYPSAGSMFKRPEGYYAAALIDQCGLKGYSVGGAQVSEKHAGFVVNRGGATCCDVLALVDDVRAKVFAHAGVSLEMEVKVLK